MSKSRKSPELSDWTVALPGSYPPVTLTVRASALNRSGGDYALEDAYGHPLFAAPKDQVLYIKRLEPGEADEPRAEYPPSVPDLKAPPVAPEPETPPAWPEPAPGQSGSGKLIPSPADPGAAETGPAGKAAPRPRSGRRGK